MATKSGTATAPAWSAEELAAVRADLEQRRTLLRAEYEGGLAGLEQLQRESATEGGGDDQADAGSKTFEREHEMSLVHNSRDLLNQAERAIGRLEAGTYGMCEICGKPIAKARLQAFPSATMCVTCKSKEERR